MKLLRPILLALLALCVPGHALAQYGGTFGQQQPGYSAGAGTATLITANLALDLSTSIGVAHTGASLTAWEDENPNSAGFNSITCAVATCGGTAPTYAATDANFNSKPSLAFVAGNCCRTGTITNVAQPQTYYLVSICTNPAAGNPATTNNNLVELMRNGTDWGATAGSVLTTTVAVNSSIHVQAFVANNTTSFIYTDSSTVNVKSGTAGTNGFGGGTWIQLTFGSAWTGSMVRLLAYNAAHSPAQVSQNLQSLAALYDPGAWQ